VDERRSRAQAEAECKRECHRTPTVYALGLAVIASVYIGFAVADGRRIVLAVESGVASMFVIIAAAAVTSTAWLLVVGLAGHGFKDLWQHRRQFVANTRWWPPFCLVVDFAVAAIISGGPSRTTKRPAQRVAKRALRTCSVSSATPGIPAARETPEPSRNARRIY
jgi:hypothetical protein